MLKHSLLSEGVFHVAGADGTVRLWDLSGGREPVAFGSTRVPGGMTIVVSAASMITGPESADTTAPRGTIVVSIAAPRVK